MADLEALVATAAAEGPQFEFKSGKLLLPEHGEAELSKKKRAVLEPAVFWLNLWIPKSVE